AGMLRKGGPAWTGMVARHAPESVAGMDRNTHQEFKTVLQRYRERMSPEQVERLKPAIKAHVDQMQILPGERSITDLETTAYQILVEIYRRTEKLHSAFRHEMVDKLFG
ncbi:MAG: hypothetical protein ACREA0_10480, partial [bacterium]